MRRLEEQNTQLAARVKKLEHQQERAALRSALEKQIGAEREARKAMAVRMEIMQERAARQLETMKAELTQNAEREKLRGEVLAMKAAMEKAALEQCVRELERTCMLQGIAQAQHSVWRSMIPTLPQGAASHSMQGTPTTGRAMGLAPVHTAAARTAH